MCRSSCDNILLVSSPHCIWVHWTCSALLCPLWPQFATASRPPLQTTATGIHMYEWTDKYNRFIFLSSSVLLFYLSPYIFLPPSLFFLPPSSTFSQVAVPQPHSHGSRLLSSPGASASEALPWEIPPETQACTLNANVQPHSDWKSVGLRPLEKIFSHKQHRERHTQYVTQIPMHAT